MQAGRGWSAAGAAACCALFFLLGALFIPYAGAQYDELLFLNGILRPEMAEGTCRLPWLGRVPVMLMSYMGTLKAALYAPVFAWFGMNDWALRVPALAGGAGSVWLFFLVARRLAGARAALLAALLLATDASYLLTAVFDWGPVVIQHLCFLAALYGGVRYAQERRARWLFLAGLASGLGLWDKALFIWVLAGFGGALLAVFPGELLAVARNRCLAGAAAAGFILGAAPLLEFNITHGWRTFTANAALETDKLLAKTVVLDLTLDGGGLLGYVAREEPGGRPENLRLAERIPLRLQAALKSPRGSWQHLLLVLAVAAAPVVCWPTRMRRVALATLVGLALAWGQELLTRNAGGTVHHTVLLFPLFHLLAALAAGAVFVRFQRGAALAAAALFLLCAGSNLAVVNTYLADLIACGPGPAWTDAARPLVEYLKAQPGRAAFPADWGILHEVLFYGANRIPMHPVADAFVQSADQPASARELEKALADPRYLFITFTPGREMFPETRRKLLEFAAARGYTHRTAEVIHDRHGAPVFEVHEFIR